MEQRVPFVRVLKLSRLLEAFFIASVTTILVIRAFLESTGYPQLGGHGLHIAQTKPWEHTVKVGFLRGEGLLLAEVAGVGLYQRFQRPVWLLLCP